MKRFLCYIVTLMVILCSCVVQSENSGAISKTSQKGESSKTAVSGEISQNEGTSDVTSETASTVELVDPHVINEGNSELKLIFELPVGNNDGEVGYNIVDKEGLSRGPEAFCILDNGAIAILDSINKRIIAFKDGELFDTISLEVCDENPVHFVADKDRYYVLDQFRNFYIIKRADNSCEKTVTLQNNNIETVAVDGDKIYFYANNNARYLLQDDKLVPDGDKYEQIRSPEDKFILKQNGIEWRLSKEITKPATKNYVPLHIDNYNNLYVKEYNQIHIPKVNIEIIIRKYNKNTNEIGYAIIDYSDSVTFAFHDCIVTDGGDIYMMLCKEDFVGIYEVTLGKTDKSQVGDWYKEVSQ